MKTQTKSVKVRPTKMATAITNAVIVHNRRQRVCGGLALFGLFLCGVMAARPMPTATRAQHHAVSQPVPACEVIESRLLQTVYPDDVIDWNNPEHNVDVYTKLVQYGCPENKEKYEQMVLREKQIADVFNLDKPVAERNCEKIEEMLGGTIVGWNSLDAKAHINNAEIYANLSERGCPENSQKYVDLAKQELEIARALQDDNLSHQDTIEVVETYKRIKMQAAAQEILDKAKKITNPAIDFIIELEKIINE